MERKRVLIVDDIATVHILTAALSDTGKYEVLTASDGEDGVRKAFAVRPDLILLGIPVPKLSGLEICVHLRDERATREVPVILLTTRGDMPSVEAGFGAGCNDYLIKPVNVSELMAKLSEFLEE